MGCTQEDTDCVYSALPPHEVKIAAFEMLETEVTQAQFLAVTGDSPSWNRGWSGHPDGPVEAVEWVAAKDFCAAIGGRLPTEAEWEYAARGGTATRFSCGETESCLSAYAWYLENAEGHAHPVKGKAANAYGLYDMLGNVREWVADCWHSDYTAAPSTGFPAWTTECDKEFRVNRGGSYPEAGLAVWDRTADPEEGWGVLPWLGFRCVRDVAVP
jgi:formylglycine-generating enzyme required for sulfatase activity